MKIEPRAIASDHTTKFYTLGNWSLDNKVFPRTSVRGQKDAEGNVDTDTLILTHAAEAAQIRVTLGGTNGARPNLKFLGLSFSNTKVSPATRPPNRLAWGKIIPTPEHSQHGYPDAKGWCSPTSLSMALSRWAEILNRPELNLTVPEVAAKVYDHDFAGTGNWPFNTAFAGSFSGMRSYVTRFDDLTEAEDWIAAGIPVILSARWDWLQPGRPPDSVGHLIVCIGFTENGDVVINDPAARLELGQSVRRIYKRADVAHSWTKSHNAVYLVYPEGAKIPANKYGHWEN
ncbi:MAG TPA: C39 family peptidase [Verrucomicrobiae bacterium]|nr:C39 family peptidase [Verrucomicrobiae bacterium]